MRSPGFTASRDCRRNSCPNASYLQSTLLPGHSKKEQAREPAQGGVGTAVRTNPLWSGCWGPPSPESHSLKLCFSFNSTKRQSLWHEISS